MRRAWLGLFLLLTLTGVPATAETLSGKVVGVHDGDTLTLLIANGGSFKQVKIRLGEIDTPELAQPYGQQAKQALSALAFGKEAQIESAGGRISTFPPVGHPIKGASSIMHAHRISQGTACAGYKW